MVKKGLTPRSVYAGRRAALATMHGKERVIRRAFRAGAGLNVVVPEGIDTDAFGTFSGEIERPASPLNVLLAKARLGMRTAGLTIGIANEGTFRPHPVIPFASVSEELMVFMDADAGLTIYDKLITAATNFRSVAAGSWPELGTFLRLAKFPSHALIVRPNDRVEPETIIKGIHDEQAAVEAFRRCRELSSDGLARVETDMRAHCNPTRMRVIARLAVHLARRLARRCPACETPGFGPVRTVAGLPCRVCLTPTPLIAARVHGCFSCNHEKTSPIEGAPHADPTYCGYCNP